MPAETQAAVDWALQQEGAVEDGMVDNHILVDYVRTYFNQHGVVYGTFSFADLEPYLP